MKILILTASLDFGGAERIIANLANNLDRTKYCVTVAGLKRGSGYLAQALSADARAKVVDLGARSKVDLKVVARLLEVIRSERPQILYTFMFHAGLLGRIIGRLLRVPIVVHSERNVIDQGSLVRKIGLRATWFLTDHFTAGSRAVRTFLMTQGGISPNRISVIRNGIDCRSFPYISRNPIQGINLVVGCVAHLERKKGYEYWLQAASVVRESVPSAKFVIVGEGKDRQRIEGLIRDENLQDSVELLGFCTDVSYHLEHMHIYMQASIYEGTPNAIIEAMATGLPVVAADVGGISELVHDGVTGFVVPPREPQLLAERVLYLYRQPSQAQEMGRAGAEYVRRNLSIEKMIAETDALFTNLLRAKIGLRFLEGVGWIRQDWHC